MYVFYMYMILKSSLFALKERDEESNVMGL